MPQDDLVEVYQTMAKELKQGWDNHGNFGVYRKCYEIIPYHFKPVKIVKNYVYGRQGLFRGQFHCD